MGKAKKVRGLHVECASCGTVNVVDAESGEILGLAGKAPAPAPANDPPVPDPPNDPPNDPPGDPPNDPADDSFLGDW